MQKSEREGELYRLGMDDAQNWSGSKASSFGTISEQLAYKRGYDAASPTATKPPHAGAPLTLIKPHQRVGANSNAEVGRDFEAIARNYFLSQGISLKPSHKVLIGTGAAMKHHAFDLGCDQQKVLVECKSHRWTAGANVPSAKLTVWNEAMYYFYLAPDCYRKIMFVLHDDCARRRVSLAQYYMSTYRHLIPRGVEFFEFDDRRYSVRKLIDES